MLVVMLVTIIIGSLAIFILYHTAIKNERAHLVNTVTSQARLIESVARFNQQHSSALRHPQSDEKCVNLAGYCRGFQATTLLQIKAAHEQFSGFGATGEFTLARLENGMIVFIWRHRHNNLTQPQPVLFSAKRAEPMRRALSNQSGSMIGLDYRNVSVLAAFEPVAVLNLGIVAKIDLAEIRAPFIFASLIIFAVALVVMIAGAALILAITNPIIHQLSKQSAFLQAILDNVSEGIVACNATGVLTMFNSVAREMHGIDLAAIPADKWAEHYRFFEEDGKTAMHQQDIPLYRALMGEIIKSQVVLIATQELDAPKRRVLVSGQSIMINTKKMGAVVSVVDITAREEYRQHLHTLLEAIPAFVYLRAPDYSIRFANQEFCRLFGQPANGPCYQLIHNRAEPCTVCPSYEVFQTGKPKVWEYDGPGGRTYIMHTHPFIDHDGTDLAVEVGMDITERKHAENQLKASEERFRRYFKCGVIGMGIVSRNREWLEANDRLCQDLGYSREILRTTTWEALTHPDDLAADVNQFNRMLSGEIEGYAIEKRIISHDKRILNTLQSVRCFRYSTGWISEVQVFMVDLTENKHFALALFDDQRYLRPNLAEVQSHTCTDSTLLKKTDAQLSKQTESGTEDCNNFIEKPPLTLNMIKFQTMRTEMGAHFQTFIPKLIDELPRRLATIVKAEQDQDLNLFVREVHKLKSAANYLGTEALAKIVIQLEAIGKTDSIADNQHLVIALIAELKLVDTAVRAAMQHIESNTKEPEKT